MYDKEKRRLTLRERRWIHGIALAVLPLLVAYGIISDESATLYVALIGAILVPSLALSDANKTERVITEEKQDSYETGLDDGWQAASSEWIAEHDSDRRGAEIERQRGKHGKL